jgi:hypothetical protein
MKSRHMRAHRNRRHDLMDIRLRLIGAICMAANMPATYRSYIETEIEAVRRLAKEA